LRTLKSELALVPGLVLSSIGNGEICKLMPSVDVCALAKAGKSALNTTSAQSNRLELTLTTFINN
jgi:hypothetical protein